jgi:hypothetical protein
MIFPPGTLDYLRVTELLLAARTVADLDALLPEIEALPAWREDLLRTYYRLRVQREAQGAPDA